VECDATPHRTLDVPVYKSLHGLTPPYLSDDCQLVTEVGRWHLGFSNIYTCVLSRTVADLQQKLHGSWTAAVEQSAG